MKNKKIIQTIIFSITFIWLFLGCITVNAASASISANKTSATVGDSVIITVRYNAATWNLHVSGAVNDSIVGYDPNGVNASQFQTYNLNTSAAGTYTVSLSGDVTDENEVNSPVGGSVTVVVSNPAPPPTPPTPTTPTTPTNPTNPSRPEVNPITAGDNKSANSNLKSITAEKYPINTVDTTHYTTSVRYSTDTLNIVAEAEDSKATVKGGGNVALKVGENVFEIVITAENGTSTTYYLTVTRKDNQYTLSDLTDALTDKDEVTVQIVKDDVITINDFEKIKDAKKKVRFVRFDEEKKTLYSIVVDGNQLGKLFDFNTNIALTFDDVTEFDEKVDYRKGLYFQVQGNVPKGVYLQVPTLGIYNDGDVVNIYSYSASGKVKKIISNVDVSNGKLEFPLSKYTKYFATQANIGGTETNPYFVATIIEFICLFVLVCTVAYTKFSKRFQKNHGSN